MNNASLYQDINGSFRKQGMRMTEQRRQILDLLIMGKSHLTVNELYRLAGKNRLKIGIATIYRTMALLEKTGLVYSLHLPDGSVRYQVKQPNEQHHHLVCEKCGRVFDIEERLIGDLEEQIYKSNGFLVTDYKIQLVGLCQACSRQKGFPDQDGKNVIDICPIPPYNS